MQRVLMITDLDPFDRSSTRLARFKQLKSFYSRQGWVLDLLVLRSEPPRGDKVHLPLAGFREILTLRSWSSVRGRDRDRLLAHIRLLGDEARYDIVHLDGVDMRQSDDHGVVWIHDAGAGERPVADCVVDQTFSLACFERDRARMGQLGAEAFRLPLSAGTGAATAGLGSMVGWPAKLNDDETDAWDKVLDALANRGANLPDGVAVCPSSTDRQHVPLLLQPDVAIVSQSAVSSVWRAIGLGVLPSWSLGAQTHVVLDTIARGCPVLLLAQAADVFEDRWHLPVSEDHAELATRVIDWAEGRNRDVLRDAAIRTHQVLREDAARMDDYVSDVLRGVLATVRETNAV